MPNPTRTGPIAMPNPLALTAIYLTLGLIAAYLSTLNHRHTSALDIAVCVLLGPLSFIIEVTRE